MRHIENQADYRAACEAIDQMALEVGRLMFQVRSNPGFATYAQGPRVAHANNIAHVRVLSERMAEVAKALAVWVREESDRALALEASSL